MINLLLITAIILIPLSGYHAMVGAVLGLLQSLAVLVPLANAPALIKRLVSKNALLADMILSALGAWATISFFGAGLMLAVATATTAIILSLALPRLSPAQ